MSTNRCKICGSSSYIYSLDIPLDDGEDYTASVCGSCWDIIAIISQRAMMRKIKEFDNRISELEEKFNND